MSGMDIQYKTLAKYYDLVYHWKDYAKEVRMVRRIISRHKKFPGKELLDVGCGTGKHLSYLKDFDRTGIDLNERMLNIARKNSPGARYVRANMTNFRLSNKFDVILCLFSAIGYARTYSNLERTVRNFSRHLKRGGVAIIEPWFTEETWHVGHMHFTTYDSNEIKVARLSYSGRKGNLSILNEHYLIAEQGKGIRHLQNLQYMGLFDLKRTLNMMKRAGMRAEFLKLGLSPGRGLLVGVKK
jgi:ubiquinone/menaquinone biosynthesis C-methylase UbiE